MKIALLQCNPVSNDVWSNMEKLLLSMRKAREMGAELCVGSELSLCGCPPNDLLLSESFIRFCGETMREASVIIKEEKLPPLLLGAPVANPVPQGKPLQNCAVLLNNGKMAVVGRKVLLGSDVYNDDHQYFEPGVACGVLQLNGWRIAVTIGEDAWNDRGFWQGRRMYEVDPVEEFMSGGADALINLTAIPYKIGGIETHKRMLAWSAAKYRVPLVCVNQVGGVDGSIFPGASMKFNASGTLCAQAAMFAEDLMLVDLTQDKCGGVVNVMDPREELWQALVLGLKDFVRKTGFSRVVLGLSGGIDSALVAALAADALGAENVLGLLMPSPYSSEGSVTDSLKLAENLGIETVTIPIDAAMKVYDSMLEPLFAGTESNTAEENIQPRIRGNLLMAVSNKFGRMLLNTGNKSELAVGYSTLYGDMCGSLAVIADLYKEQVYELSHWANERGGGEVIPPAILEKEPSAELKPDQRDSDSLPPYPELDAILRLYLEEGKGRDELVELGYDRNTVVRVITMLRRAEFKRQQAPTLLRVSGRPFGADVMPVSASLQTF